MATTAHHLNRRGAARRLVCARLFNRARGITMQPFRVGPETVRTRNNEMQGVPVSAPRAIGSSRAGRVVRVPVGDWPSGLYFLRLTAADGRVGYAPFVVRPRVLGASARVAVVLATNTWQAYNFRWKVTRAANRLTRVKLWRELGRPEAALVGVQYAGSNHGAVQKPYVVGDAPAWTGLTSGETLGSQYGIEIDARAAATPPGTVVLARVPDLMGPGHSAEMTYYE